MFNKFSRKILPEESIHKSMITIRIKDIVIENSKTLYSICKMLKYEANKFCENFAFHKVKIKIFAKFMMLSKKMMIHIIVGTGPK